MTPEAKLYLERAREDLDDASKIMGLPIARAAARAAYYAMFHAAEALIVEHTQKIAKTHSGVRSEFSRLMNEMSAVDQPLTASIGRAYSYKEMGDYGTNTRGLITEEQARSLMVEATHFVERITALLSAQDD